MNAKYQSLLLSLGIACLTAAPASAGDQGNPNPGILPPGATFKGKTASEWTEAWWRWVIGTPGNAQMFDATGEFAHANNNGADGVFFLAKSWAFVPQTRTVTVPSGMPLLVPVMGIASQPVPVGGNLEQFGSMDAYWAFLESLIPGMHDLSVVIDGQPVAGLEDGNLHYLNFPGENGLAIVKDPTGAELEIGGFEIALMLTPLTPGQHVIQMKGSFGAGFATDVTYLLTVKPGK